MKINDIEEDIVLITKIIQKLMMKEKLGGRTYNRISNYKNEGLSKKERENREGAKEVICYKCRKSSHVKYDCPLYKAKRENRI